MRASFSFLFVVGAFKSRKKKLRIMAKIGNGILPTL